MILMRMDRYDESKMDNDEEKKVPVLSRTQKNQEMYEELYLNNKVVDLNNVITEKEDKKDETIPAIEDEPTIYEEKNYSINDYLKKAHEKIVDDQAMRDLDNQEFKDQEDEIVKLIASIDEKASDDDFFKDLRGDNEDTMIKGTLKTDEFNTSIYETLAEDKKIDNETLLDKALGDETILNLKINEADKIDYTFEKIIEDEHKVSKKKKELPLIVFSITLFMLIMVIIIIILFH